MAIRISPASTRQPKGFTLIEIMVASAISSLLLLMLLQVFDSATNSWSGYHRQVDVDREARAALHLMAEDLSSFYGGRNGVELPLEIDWDEAAQAEPNSLDGDYHSNELAFFSLKSQDAQSGDHSDLCIVGYYLAVTADPQSASSSTPTRYSQKLYRYFRGSDLAFDSSGSTPPDPSNVDPLAPDLLDFITASTPPALAPAATVSGSGGNGLMSTTDEPVAFNVIQFRAIPYYLSSSSDTSTITTSSDELWGSPASPDPTLPPLPGYIDLVLRVTNYETINKIADSSSPADHSDASDVSTYRTRVHLAH